MPPEPQPDRIVRPRKRNHPKLPVVAVSNGHTLTEDGTLGTVDELIGTLRTYTPTLFAAIAAADLVATMHTTYRTLYPRQWQWRAIENERDIRHPELGKVASRVNVTITYFGFKGGNYHRIIDPVAMYGHKLDTVYPGDDDPLIRLLKWGVSLRDFCAENNMEVRATIGATAAQFLTDPRFYPRARRKVPAKTNQHAREQLPGNYYRLDVQPSAKREFTAYYLDQRRAHHYHAAELDFPHADLLYAYGYFTDPDHGIAFDHASPEHFYGLYCLDLRAPIRHPGFRWLPKAPCGSLLKSAYVYSNELSYLEEQGYEVLGVRAAWGSRKKDTGLNIYAKWASEQLDSYGDQPWLKPLLLSTYGILAVRPGHAEAVFRLASSGKRVTLYTGRGKLVGRHTQRAQKLEPNFANVLQRGMIEAATRVESISYANWLSSVGYRVLSIYADAVIVEAQDGQPAPLAPAPWRNKRTLTHLQFINQQAFISGEMTKLPGIGRELLQYRQATPGKAPKVRRATMFEAVTGRELQHTHTYLRGAF